jgi:hypothetical protein
VTEILIVSFCALFALITGYSLFGAWKTGKIKSRGWAFDRAASPTGFWLVAVIDLVILIGSLVVALHALGVIGSIPSAIRV